MIWHMLFRGAGGVGFIHVFYSGEDLTKKDERGGERACKEAIGVTGAGERGRCNLTKGGSEIEGQITLRWRWGDRCDLAPGARH